MLVPSDLSDENASELELEFARVVSETAWSKTKDHGIQCVHCGVRDLNPFCIGVLGDGTEVFVEASMSDLCRLDPERKLRGSDFMRRCGAYFADAILTEAARLRAPPVPARTAHDAIADGEIPLPGGGAIQLNDKLKNALGDMRFEIARDLTGVEL
jgi:hypothetical protein